MNIVPQEHWDNGYCNFVIEKASDSDPITKLLKKHIPRAKHDQQAFELGCFPGRFLCVLGDLGYTLNGVDTTSSMHNFEKSLNSLGYKTNLIENKNYTDAQINNYDVVASFGFIEHFTNWEEVINSHVLHLASNGYLIITTPNFKGLLQYIYHLVIDKKNLDRHITASMSPKKWKKILTNSGLMVISNGYIGYGFWDESNRYSLPFRLIRKIATVFFKIVQKICPDHSSIASYCYIVAKKI